MDTENLAVWGKNAVDAVQKNSLPQYLDNAFNRITLILLNSNWDSSELPPTLTTTIDVSGEGTLLIFPDEGTVSEYNKCKVQGERSNNLLQFTAHSGSIPSIDLKVHLLFLNFN